MAKRYIISIFDTEGEEELADFEVTTGLPELLTWWVGVSVSDFNATVPKIEEYGQAKPQDEEGSADLRLIGENIAELIGLRDADSALKQELGAWFYLQGKTARCVANYKQGKPAKPDTLLDTSVYAMIMRRLQETGQWP